MVQGGTKIPMGVTITLIVGLKNFYSIILMFKIFNMFFPNSGMLYSAQKNQESILQVIFLLIQNCLNFIVQINSFSCKVAYIKLSILSKKLWILSHWMVKDWYYQRYSFNWSELCWCRLCHCCKWKSVKAGNWKWHQLLNFGIVYHKSESLRSSLRFRTCIL